MDEGADNVMEKALTAIDAFTNLERACQECAVAFAEQGQLDMANVWTRARGEVLELASAVMAVYQLQNEFMVKRSPGEKPHYDA